MPGVRVSTGEQTGHRLRGDLNDDDERQAEHQCQPGCLHSFDDGVAPLPSAVETGRAPRGAIGQKVPEQRY